MQFMIIRKADAATEALLPPAPALIEDMERFNQQFADQGRLGLALGLRPSAHAVAGTHDCAPPGRCCPCLAAATSGPRLHSFTNPYSTREPGCLGSSPCPRRDPRAEDRRRR